MRSRIFSTLANLFFLVASLVLISEGILNSDQLSCYADKIELNEEGKQAEKKEQKQRSIYESDFNEFKYSSRSINIISYAQYCSLTANSLCYLEIQTPPPEKSA